MPRLRDASALDVASTRISRVVVFRLEPGSFMAMFPSRPMPITSMSMPP